ncbi:hypothetical protein F7R01_02570 [Pseudomonas argentinensis]|uniref:Putative tricarboxylic transport membrane protein n=1 Tax=Phytopseudomonas argentinensis TaxID=289370 RepID=A0A1I3N7Z5_9GAMM|nr:tripartite tricarboxylate transporter permease [Pseudomonas argentinensis]KAB0550116.1 hypothetical protein F7R01_02570 [Pseudomonas argentinensis]SFJ05378.1 putative tricarboxylic transport membrane protein [Pseudomonas argentinensis]
MLDNILLGLSSFNSFSVCFALLIGALIGYVIGAIPGLGPTLGVSLLIPFTYAMDPISSIVMLVGLYVAAEYGGAITAIILNTPGTAAAVATAWDGYPLNLQGNGGKALNVSIVASGIGMLISSFMFLFTAVPLSEIALKLGPIEYFAIGLVGLSLASGLSANQPIKGAIAMGVGLVFAFVGLDPQTGVPRFTPSTEFFEGIPLVPALLGLYALSEVFIMLEDLHREKKPNVSLGGIFEVPMALFYQLKWVILKSTVIGYLVGVIPGAGASVASFLAYAEAKRSSKEPENFGKGSYEGVAASETANNSAVSGNLAPMLALGIPGSATTAVLVGALMVHGVQPGPLLFTKNPEIPYTILASLWFGVPIMVLIGLLGSKLWARFADIPVPVIAAIVAGLSLIGAYATENSFFPVAITVAFGVFGYLCRKADFPTAPIILALVLGEMIEVNLRRALIISDGDWTVFLTNSVSLILLVVSLLAFLLPALRLFRKTGRG